MKDVEVADYVVVGAGSAGSIVAARLSAAGASVIVVESAVLYRRPDVTFPLGIVSLFATANWKYDCAPDPSKGTGAEAFAGGKIVGGSGSINAMVYVRGRRSDYDGWVAGGCEGWSYDDVLPHFKAIENWVGGADEYREMPVRYRSPGAGTITRSTTRSSRRRLRPDTSATPIPTGVLSWESHGVKSISVADSDLLRRPADFFALGRTTVHACTPGRPRRG